MKILHIIHSVNPLGGGPIEGIKQLALGKTKLGCEIEVATLDRPDAPWLKDFPLKVHALGPSWLGYGYSPKVIPWLKAHCHEYNLIVVNGIWQFNGFAAWRVLRKTEIPYFVFTHGMLDPWFKEHYPLKHLKKCLYWFFAESHILREASAVLFTCTQEKIMARKSFPLYRCNEKVVNYGTGGWRGDAEAQRKAFLERFPELQGKRLLLFLGRIHEKKGGDLLVEAFHRFISENTNPDYHLVMAGPADNAFGNKLRKMVHALGLEDRVTWTGMVEGDIKWGAFQASEVFLLPSHQENFGISVAEALSASVPVLISNKVNICYEIDADKAGLVENDDLEGTLALFKRWDALPESERRQMRENARACFLAHFEIMGAAQSLLNVYCQEQRKKNQ